MRVVSTEGKGRTDFNIEVSLFDDEALSFDIYQALRGFIFPRPGLSENQAPLFTRYSRDKTTCFSHHA